MTVADLATRAHVEIGYLLVLQGCPFMFTDRPELVGTGAGSWIGEDYGPRRVLEGLDIKGAAISYATEMGDGRPDTDDGLTFRVVDFDRELIEFFRARTAASGDAVPVGGRLGPKDDPAPANLIGLNGDNVPIWGKWINAEAIGPAGERSYYSLLPGGDAAGQDHAAYSGDLLTLAPSYVYESATHLEGRRVALYRIFRDPDSGKWAGWGDQHDSGHSLIWVGSLTNDAEVEDITWTIKAEGPSSWLRKQLGAQRAVEWQRVSGDITLSSTPGAREDLFALSFVYHQVSDGNIEYGGASFFDTVDDVLPTTGNASDFRLAINTRIAAVSALAGADITWTTNRNAEASLEVGGATTRIDDTPGGGFIKAAKWALAAHEKVWRAHGFDPYAQKATAYDTDYEIHFLTGEASGIPALPGPGYWVGHFWTVPVGYASVAAAGPVADNNGQVRVAQVIAPPDLTQLPPGAKAELSFGIGAPAYLEGQTNRAPVEHALSNAGGDCDTNGYAAFRGSYIAGPNAEVETMVQLGQICWHADAVTLGGDTIGLDNLGHARVYLARWIDPRFHGIDRKPLDRIWAAHDLEWAPVNFFGHAHYSGDFAHRILLRLMLSTGTAEWAGYDGDGATLTVGANHPAALTGLEPFSDAEIADLGLAIPHELIDVTSFGVAAGSLPGGIAGDLNRCRYAWIGAQDSQELLAAVLAPRGWGLGFCRGQWRLFSRPDLLTDDDVEVTIGPGDIVGDPSFVELANMRPFMPREKFSVNFSRSLVTDAATEDRELTMTVRSLDPASRSRRDNGQDDIDGWGLIPTPLWRGENAPDGWADEWSVLFARIMGGWYNAAHTLIPGLPVMPSIARQVGPGTVVRLTSYYAPTREGVYGPVAKLGRVYKVEHDLETREARIDILIQPGDESDIRFFAPVAWVIDDAEDVEDRHDATTRTFFCLADWTAHGGSIHDVAAFEEPAGLGVGGDALVHGWQWNGRVWAKTFEFSVESVSTSGDSITYKAGSLSGAFGESCYTVLVLAPYDDQPVASWPRSVFSVLTRPDFKFGAGPTQGWPLV